MTINYSADPLDRIKWLEAELATAHAALRMLSADHRNMLERELAERTFAANREDRSCGCPCCCARRAMP